MFPTTSDLYIKEESPKEVTLAPGALALMRKKEYMKAIMSFHPADEDHMTLQISTCASSTKYSTRSVKAVK